jgi:hypothetical protein
MKKRYYTEIKIYYLLGLVYYLSALSPIRKNQFCIRFSIFPYPTFCTLS